MSFPLDKFRVLYPAFAGESDATIEAMAEQAHCVAKAACACGDQIWMAIVAHLSALDAAVTSGDGGSTSGNVTSASVGSVSVSYGSNPAASSSSWGYWLSQTPYGQKAMAMLQACSTGGMYVGGLPERDAFRGVYGVRGGVR